METTSFNKKTTTLNAPHKTWIRSGSTAEGLEEEKCSFCSKNQEARASHPSCSTTVAPKHPQPAPPFCVRKPFSVAVDVFGKLLQTGRQLLVFTATFASLRVRADDTCTKTNPRVRGSVCVCVCVNPKPSRHHPQQPRFSPNTPSDLCVDAPASAILFHYNLV